MSKKNGKNGNTEYGVLVTIESETTYAGYAYNIFKATTVELKDYRELEYLPNYHDWHGLTLRAQQSEDQPGTYTGEPYYDASYTNVTLDKAMTYVKTLTRVGKYLEREIQTRGSAQDYAEHVVRFALALGIKTIVEKPLGGIEGYPCHYRTLGDGAYWLRREAQAWADQHSKARQTA